MASLKELLREMIYKINKTENEKISSVNGITPDKNGNVDVDITGAGIMVSDTEPEDTSVLWIDTDDNEPDELQEAINEALAQAKASGEFDGKPGQDYVITDDDIQEIAEKAAELVDTSDSPITPEDIGAQIADFVVNMVSDGTEDGLTPDRTWGELTEAYLAGRRLSCMYDGREYTLVAFYKGEEAHFCHNSITELKEHRIYFLYNSKAYMSVMPAYSGAFPVQSVNDKTGAVKLTAEDVDAQPKTLVVTLTKNDDETFTASHSSEEVEAHVNAGGDTHVLFGDFLYRNDGGNVNEWYYVSTMVNNLSVQNQFIVIYADKTAEVFQETYEPNLENVVKTVNGISPDESGNVEIEVEANGNTSDGTLLYSSCIVERDGEGNEKPYPIELEHYSWTHLAGTKAFAPAVKNATLFTTEGATAHEANAAGFGGDKWYLFQWVQNVVGTSTDMEDANGSCEIHGKLMYWRYGAMYDLTSQSDAFAIAKKGDTITRTVAGDTITASGGVGICNIARHYDGKKLYSIATYYHNGVHIPTTREVFISATEYNTDPNSNYIIGAPTMWTLTKDGTKYDMNDSILGTEYGGHVNCQIYCDYASSAYTYYMALVRPDKGISIISSSDCTNWTWLADIDIPVTNTAYIETAFTKYAGRWYVAVRCKDGRLWVAKVMPDYAIDWNFFIPDCGSKPMFIQTFRNLLLACAPHSRYGCRIYRFTSSTAELGYTQYPSRLEAVVDIEYNACNYPFFVDVHSGRPGLSTYNGENIRFLCLGTNNFVTNKLGCSYYIARMPAGVTYLRYPNEAVDALNAPADIAALTFTGAVTGTYDGKTAMSIEIPKQTGVQTVNGISPDENGNVVVDVPEGGDGGKAKTEKLIDVTFTEATASISVKLEHNFHKLFLVWNCGDSARTVDAEGVAISSNKLGVVLGSAGFGWNARKVGMIYDNGKPWLTDTLLMEWTGDLSTYLGADGTSVGTGVSSNRVSYFGGASALLGTVASSDAMAPASGTELFIVLNTGFFAPNTRIVLVGEYFE